MPPDRLILVSDKADNPIRFDKGYVYVEGGDDFGRAHATVFADAGTARLSFGTARLGLDHLLKNGGSAYLPDRLVQPHLGNDLHKLKDAPVFTRPSYVVSRSTVRAGWPWFDDAIAAMT